VFCPTPIDPGCLAGSLTHQAASAVTGGAMDNIASAIRSGVAWMVSNTVDWWVKVGSLDLAAEPAVGKLQQWIFPLAVAFAVLAMLTAAGKMALTRKANPLIDVGSGLAIIAATSAAGVLLPTLLLQAGDAWSNWVLGASTGGQFGKRLTEVLSLNDATTGVAIVLGILAIIITAVQAVLMLFRQAALVILAGILPLAAAGTLIPATRPWFRKVTGWMLALIFYKPAAAAVYATAFTMIGSSANPSSMLMGFAMVVLSLAALPALMKFFTWTTGAAESATSGGGFLTAAVGGAVAVGALRGSIGGSGGSSAAEQARSVSAQLGPQDPGPAGPQGPQGAASPASGTGRTAASTSGAGPGGPGAGPAAGPATATRAGVGASGAAAGTSGPATGTGGPATRTSGPSAGTSGPAGVGSRSAAGPSGTAGGSAAGPAGMAATGLASGTADAARATTDAVQPPRDEKG
jgi:hypothetical protein